MCFLGASLGTCYAIDLSNQADALTALFQFAYCVGFFVYLVRCSSRTTSQIAAVVFYVSPWSHNIVHTAFLSLSLETVNSRATSVADDS